MAEIKTGIFAKNVQKRLSRAQEKVLQKLGKADETKDDHFDQAVQNFKRQETEGSRLQREMKAYLAAVKAMQQASINLTESLHEVYEPDWHGKDDVLSIGKNCDALWEDFHQKLVDSSLSTLDTYLQQFPDLKIRVAKRSRKLIDYDSARHHLETIQAVANRSDRKVTKAEEELKKAQKVFDELNVGLQDELPTLWDSRVGFYVNTFKNVTSLEAKFHREISVLCRQLYEVMTKLGEQHSDKMFTIQGAPSDSGPLRLSRAPSPPDSDSDESPGTTPNHMLAPISPGPPRPKSPSGQGPPVPPPPKTPTKELHQEQIIDLFGGQFLPAASPSQPNERPGESLLDLDFDPFKPDTNAPIGQAVSPLTQQLPWDLWTGSVEPVQPAEDSGFAPNWAADFSAAPENGDTVPPATEGAAEELPTATGKEEAQSWPSEDGWGGEAAGQPQGAESATAGDEVTSNAFNGFPQMEATAPTFVADFDKLNESEAIEAPEAPVLPAAIAGTSEAPGAESQVVPEAGEIQETAPTTGEAEVAEIQVTAPPTGEAEVAEIQVTAPPTGEAEVAEIQVTAPPAGEAEVAELQETTSPTGETVVAENLEAAPPTGEAEEAESATSPNVEKPASTEASPVSEEAAPTEISPGEEAEKASPSKTVTLESVPTLEEVNESPLEETLEPVEAKGSPQEETPTVVAEQVDENFKEATGANEGTAEAKPNEEKMPIPSVVIEPASSNEGDDDRDIVDIISPTAISDNGVISDSQAAKNINASDGPPGLPPGYLYKVETLHDFEAANSDELDLKRGDIVLVVPTATVEDQDAGWLTGIKESDWLHLGACAHQGLFPENFTQRLE
ncbi:amphiphysin isoform X2 [Esox lucius]|uniref:amphiphysin isoform X2 n=1 Tax=Esox lucius TaxID=8010 RepID=UPI001476D7F9|nr:amphiphysin isoform X2 [Esox lucius]